MSPLACSLLALAALLAVATAIMPPPGCGYPLSLGKAQTKDEISFKMTTAEGRLVIPDRCSLPGRTLVGEFVAACSRGTGGPSNVDRVIGIDNVYEQVDITCPEGCSEIIDVSVIQYCEMVTSPTHG